MSSGATAWSWTLVCTTDVPRNRVQLSAAPSLRFCLAEAPIIGDLCSAHRSTRRLLGEAQRQSWQMRTAAICVVCSSGVVPGRASATGPVVAFRYQLESALDALFQCAALPLGRWSSSWRSSSAHPRVHQCSAPYHVVHHRNDKSHSYLSTAVRSCCPQVG